jgi:anthranilate/para-aminobenzoate synthase component I
MVIPSKEEFIELVKHGRIPPLYLEIPYLSPCLAYESLAAPNSLFLESVKGPENIARYSFIGFDPCLIFKAKHGVVEIEYSGTNTEFSNKPLSILKNLIGVYQQIPFDYLPPFQGGMVGVFSYDFVQYLERIPQNALNDLNLPDAHFLMVDKLIAFDHLTKKCRIIVCPGARDSLNGQVFTGRTDWSEEYDSAVDTIEKILKRVNSYKLKVISEDVNVASRIPDASRKIDIVYEMKKKDYMDIVKKAKEYIAAGDIFQANLSQRVSAHISDKSPWELYKILRSINPSPFAAFADFGDYQVVSSSPERLVRVKDGIIETRPIVGTRPRGGTAKRMK